jgi:hypothetical protein
MAKRATGEFRWRFAVLPCVYVKNAANNEDAPTWPEPAGGAREYQAARENFTAGETIAQSIRQSTGSMKFRVKGVRIPVNPADRIRLKTTGELFNVTGVARDEGLFETIITVERVAQQPTPQ